MPSAVLPCVGHPWLPDVLPAAAAAWTLPEHRYAAARWCAAQHVVAQSAAAAAAAAAAGLRHRCPAVCRRYCAGRCRHCCHPATAAAAAVWAVGVAVVPGAWL